MRRTRLLLVSVALLGCSEPTPSGDVVVSDSAGVAIVTNGERQMARAALWRLGSSPSVAIESDSEVTLFEVTALARTASGVIAAVNRGSDEILLFDREGTFVGRRGSEGDGPGEFRWLSSVLPLGGDSIGAYDFGHKRLSVFDPTGRLTREFTLSGIEGDYEILLPVPGGGFAVFTNKGMSGGSPGVFRSVSESFSIDRDGRRTGSYGEFPGAEMFMGRMAGMVLFGANSFAAVVGPGLVIGTAKEPELRFYSNDRQLQRIVRWPDHERAVTAERVERFVVTAQASVPEPAREQARAVFAELPKSDTEPAFEDVLASPDGELWVGEYPGPEMALDGARSPQREWLVFDSLGALMARVSTPVGFRPLSVGAAEVIGVFVDELGVESIQVYEVIREAG